MKLVHDKIETRFFFNPENQVFELVIENRPFFSSMVKSLVVQQQGDEVESGFVLSDDEKITILDFEQNAEVIIDPFNLDNNKREFIGKITKQLISCAQNAGNLSKTIELEARLNVFAAELISELNGSYEITPNVNAESIIKAFSISIENEVTSLDSLVNYLSLAKELGGRKLIFMVGLRNYLSDKETEEIIKEFKYRGINVLLVENSCYVAIEGLKRIIIDKDMCEIS